MDLKTKKTSFHDERKFFLKNGKYIIYCGKKDKTYIKYNVDNFFRYVTGESEYSKKIVSTKNMYKIDFIFNYLLCLNKIPNIFSRYTKTILQTRFNDLRHEYNVVNLNRSCYDILKKHTFHSIYEKYVGINSKIIKKQFRNNPKYFISGAIFIPQIKSRFNRGQLEDLFGLNICMRNMATCIDLSDFTELDAYNLTIKWKKDYEKNSIILRDTVSQLVKAKRMNVGKIIIPKFKTFRELHDKVTIQFRKLKTKDYKFNIRKELLQLDGLKVGDTTIVLPKTRHELVDWGNKMNNCISSYHEKFHCGNTDLIGVKNINGDLIYNIEIKNNKLIQFVKNHNQTEHRTKMKPYFDLFKEMKLL